MQVGTIEEPLEEKVLTRRRSRSSGSGTPSGGNRNGDDGGGSSDDGRSGNNYSDSGPDTINRDKSRVITWFLLLVVLMTFGGLIGAYVVVATNRAIEWQPFSLPFQVWISTAILLASSITYELARRAIYANEHPKIQRFTIATTVLGAIFISSQILLWLSLAGRGLYMRGNPYAGFFYILTAAHAIHVLGGVVALGAILLRCWYPTENNDEIVYRQNLGRSVGWYWHFMGGLWIVLFILLGFWK